jgi:hypothetical protein
MPLKWWMGGKRPGAGRPRKRPLPPPAPAHVALLAALRQLADGDIALKQRLSHLKQVGLEQSSGLPGRRRRWSEFCGTR